MNRAAKLFDRPFGLPQESIADSDARLIELYRKHGSVWRVGAEVGMTGQQVHSRFRKIGYDISRPPEFSLEQIEQLKAYYRETPAEKFNLAELASALGKSRPNVARFARRLGLTKHNRPVRPEAKEKMRKPRRWKNGHPRGFLGQQHSAEAKAIISEKSKRAWATFKTFGIGNMAPDYRDKISARMQIIAANRPASANFSRTKGGKRSDLGDIHFRSSWEANYARYLNLMMKMGVVEKWDFEPETFWFDGIKRGVCSYKPDFRIKYKGDDRLEYVEIKGWIVAKDRVKWKRMAKYHPHIRLVIVKAKEYYTLKRKWGSAIQNWESYETEGGMGRQKSVNTTVSPEYAPRGLRLTLRSLHG